MRDQDFFWDRVKDEKFVVQQCDGGVAPVVTSVERARDLRQPRARILAASQAHAIGGDFMFDYYRPEFANFEEARSAPMSYGGRVGSTRARSTSP